jgi:aminoglycoside phosphotransferase (APT) family kinase protein
MSPVATSLSASINTVLRTLLPAWSSAAVTVIETLPGGFSHRNLRLRHEGQDYVLRMPAAEPDARANASEMDWLGRLPAGLGAPLVAFNPNDGAMLTRWIDAPLLADTASEPNQLVRYLVRLHQHMPLTTRDCNLPARIDRWLGSTTPPAAVTRARKRLVLDTSTLRSCHNDLNPYNILCEPLAWRTLDWEWVGLNDPLFDLVSLALGAGRTLHELPQMGRLYLTAMTDPVDDPNLQRRLDQAVGAFWLREYAWAVAAIRGGNHREEILRQEHTALDWLQRL